jgi:hypothetical protein
MGGQQESTIPSFSSFHFFFCKRPLKQNGHGSFSPFFLHPSIQVVVLVNFNADFREFSFFYKMEVWMTFAECLDN